jgi:hypothetical protein
MPIAGFAFTSQSYLQRQTGLSSHFQPIKVPVNKKACPRIPACLIIKTGVKKTR